MLWVCYNSLLVDILHVHFHAACSHMTLSLPRPRRRCTSLSLSYQEPTLNRLAEDAWDLKYSHTLQTLAGNWEGEIPSQSLRQTGILRTTRSGVKNARKVQTLRRYMTLCFFLNLDVHVYNTNTPILQRKVLQDIKNQQNMWSSCRKLLLFAYEQHYNHVLHALHTNLQRVLVYVHKMCLCLH